jgi:hypothetical protein
MSFIYLLFLLVLFVLLAGSFTEISRLEDELEEKVNIIEKLSGIERK